MGQRRTPAFPYTDAVNWAAARGIIARYSDGRFGVGDPITREQMAAILWSYAGSPGAEAGQDFADESEIATYAVTAVDWAWANGIMNGKDGNLFDPKGSVTRAETAAALYHYMTMTTDTSAKQENSAEPETAVESGKTLVVYFPAAVIRNRWLSPLRMR